MLVTGLTSVIVMLVTGLTSVIVMLVTGLTSVIVMLVTGLTSVMVMLVTGLTSVITITLVSPVTNITITLVSPVTNITITLVSPVTNITITLVSPVTTLSGMMWSCLSAFHTDVSRNAWNRCVSSVVAYNAEYSVILSLTHNISILHGATLSHNAVHLALSGSRIHILIAHCFRCIVHYMIFKR
jgi:hypothetical protein